MSLFPRCHSCLFLVPAAFVFSAFACAQSLGAPVRQACAGTSQGRRHRLPRSLSSPKGTSLQVEISHHYPVKIGEPIQAHLMHPIYSEGKLVVPRTLRSKATSLPFRPTQRRAGMPASAATSHPSTPSKSSSTSSNFPPAPCPSPRIRCQWRTCDQTECSRESRQNSRSSHADWAEAKANMRDRIAYFTAPGKGDRALQLLYHQLPYHPERIDAQHRMVLRACSAGQTSASATASVLQLQNKSLSGAGKSEIWSVNATSSARFDLRKRPSPAIPSQALVVEPVYDKDKQLGFPRDPGSWQSRQSPRQPADLAATESCASHSEGAVSRGLQPEKLKATLAERQLKKDQNLSLDAEGTINSTQPVQCHCAATTTMLDWPRP